MSDETPITGEVFSPGEATPAEAKALHHVAKIHLSTKTPLERFNPNRKFDSAEELFWAIQGYFEWCEENPLTSHKPVTVAVGNGGGSEVTQATTYTARPYTQTGMLLFIGCAKSTWEDWQDEGGPKHWPRAMPVIEWAKGIIANQKYERALIGDYNPMMVARDLGLVDKKEVESRARNVDVQAKMQIDPKDLSYTERKAILDAVAKQKERTKAVEVDDSDIDDLLG